MQFHGKNRIIQILFILLFLTPVPGLALDKTGLFSGRISRINEDASLIRIKVDFVNMKYLNKKDKVEFWDERFDSKKCEAYIIGKSNEYLLLKIPDFIFCQKSVYLNYGGYLKFYSQDLVNNLKMGKEVVNILIKKRLALRGSLDVTQRELDNHIERVAAVNKRYEVLKDKLEKEWRGEISALEEDRNVSLRNYNAAQLRLEEIDNKMVKYRIEDENLYYDRWALDPRLFYKK